MPDKGYGRRKSWYHHTYRKLDGTTQLVSQLYNFLIVGDLHNSYQGDEIVIIVLALVYADSIF